MQEPNYINTCHQCVHFNDSTFKCMKSGKKSKPNSIHSCCETLDDYILDDKYLSYDEREIQPFIDFLKSPMGHFILDTLDTCDTSQVCFRSMNR